MAARGSLTNNFLGGVDVWPLMTIAKLVGSVVLAASVTIGTVVIFRPPAPPPADPAAGERAGRHCIAAINDAIRDGAISISLPGGDRVVKTVNYATDGIEVQYALQNGQYESAIYDFATFFTNMVGEVKTPKAQLFSYIGQPWLECTKALQYYEQEKAKEVARYLQNWVFGPPVREPQALPPEVIEPGRGGDGPGSEVDPPGVDPPGEGAPPAVDRPVEAPPGLDPPPEEAPGGLPPPDNVLPGPEGRGSTPGGDTPGGTPPGGQPLPLADLSIAAIEVRNLTSPGGRYLCGNQVSLTMAIDNPNSQPVDSVVEAIVFQNNGQTAFGDGRQVSLPAGRSTESWTFTLPTDWFTYPYTYEFVAYLKPGGYFNSGELRASQSPGEQFIMECNT